MTLRLGTLAIVRETGVIVNKHLCYITYYQPGYLMCYAAHMPKPRGRSHTTLTETAHIVVKVLQKLPDIKMIAPGKISTSSRRASGRFITIVYTAAGFELIISGQSTQKLAVHTSTAPQATTRSLKHHSDLSQFVFKERQRMPGV